MEKSDLMYKLAQITLCVAIFPTLIFVLLKIIPNWGIDWSWVWVLSPIWLVASLILLFFVVFICIIMTAIIKDIHNT